MRRMVSAFSLSMSRSLVKRSAGVIAHLVRVGATDGTEARVMLAILVLSS